MKKNVVVLGSTGSIGTQTLDVLRALPEEFSLLAVSAAKSVDRLLEQASAFLPRYVGIAEEKLAHALKSGLPAACRIEAGEGVNCAFAALPEADIIVIGISGIDGLSPLLAALKAGKTVALANKESIVCGNPLVKEALEAYHGKIIPVDSEHSAIFQCLQNGAMEEVETLILTASGGPFRGFTEERLKSVTPEQALKHPVWRMGAKITIDSATLFNKGLEVIEASFLYGLPNTQISVLIHPQSIVHSMVEYKDGATIAQLAAPDMRLAVQYALSYPRRLRRNIPRLDLAALGALTFEDGNAQPAIRLARAALTGTETLPIVYNAANEAAVNLFVAHKIGFLDIRRAVEEALSHTPEGGISSLEDVLEVDAYAREFVRTLFSGAS
ncbi:MAG TPA: 1-deoxy-D-xylulose-5-phosphate reductoisomerase [Feifaniaceae bacterium]|nr:1-deoxy-D-xylulose-5-phosphate reductoisomerase [Feifaniaceae bacterium]